MSKFIPNQSYQVLAQNRLRPGSFGKIPTQAINDYYNRMEKAYYETQAGMSRIEEQLAKDMAGASEADKRWLSGMYEDVNKMIDTASTNNDFHNRVRQVRDMARSVAGNTGYQTIKYNMAQGAKQKDLMDRLAATIGIENVVVDGDDYRTHQSIGDDGSMRRVQGTVTKLPDFGSAARKLAEKGATVTQTFGSVDNFVENGGVDLYMQEGAGRIHADMLSKELYGQPYKSLPNDQKTEIEGLLEAHMKQALYTKVDKDTKGLGAYRGRDYMKQAMGTTSGTMQPTLTDDTSAADQTIVTLNTGTKVDEGMKSQAYESLRAAELNFLDFGDDYRSSRGKVDPNEITDLRFSPAIDPNTGESVVQISMKQEGQGKDAIAPGAGYVTMPPENMRLLASQYGDEYMELMRRDQGGAFYRASLPFLSAMADPQLGPNIVNSELDEFTTPVMLPGPNGEMRQMKIVRSGDKFTVKDVQSDRVVRAEGGPLQNLSQGALRTFIGELTYNNAQGQ